MITSFFRRLEDPVGLALIDLTQMNGHEYYVSRINVPAAHRRRGIGNALMREMCEAADLEGVSLILEVSAYGGGMSNFQLIHWYERNGFVLEDIDDGQAIMSRAANPSFHRQE